MGEPPDTLEPSGDRTGMALRLASSSSRAESSVLWLPTAAGSSTTVETGELSCRPSASASATARAVRIP